MRVLILSFSSIHKDPRVLRQIDFLESIQDSSVFLSGLQYQGTHEFIPLMNRERTMLEKIQLIFLNLFRVNSLKEKKFLQLVNLKKLGALVVKNEIDLIIANDLETWPVAFALKSLNSRIKIILDAHEYYPRHFENKFLWKLMHSAYYKYICDQYIHRADKLITVSAGIKSEYDDKFDVQSALILNSPEFAENLNPNQMENGSVKLIHHGIANSSRKLEKMIRMMDYLQPRFHLYLMLMPTDESYFNKLKKMAKGKRITFLNPVPTTEISAYINQFDIGVFLLEPVNFNYANALPNKFFEFIQARLAIVVGPSPEMSQIVLNENNGAVASTYDEIEVSDALNALTTEQIQEMKMRSHEISWKYSNQLNEQVMSDIFKELNLEVLHKENETTN
ncbi:glycosyltransferase [Algoriphagus chordae]|uniref:Glycosyltransferase involved in cell wall biosynthesis n=1 Tax=Algoriphagus chordae TaxID=237019 RepID=A0A2W7QGW0_9BACT|nr:glycosyltransferase [Algoriphagus chordae]PZX47694.1 glycosyltransferase involved in cell wall biosynthesis [Algoriphagus chordae]